MTKTIDRRTVLGALGTTVASGLAAPTVTQALTDARDTQRLAAAPPRPKTQVIDVHTHMYSRRWQANLKAANDSNVRVRPGPNGDSMVYRWTSIGSLGPEMFDWDARIERCWDRMARQKETKGAPTAYLRRLYFDAIVYDQPTLDHLVHYVGANRVLYGSDYPFSIGDMPGVLARVDTLPPDDRDKVRGGNAEKLFELQGLAANTHRPGLQCRHVLLRGGRRA